MEQIRPKKPSNNSREKKVGKAAEETKYQVKQKAEQDVS